MTHRPRLFSLLPAMPYRPRLFSLFPAMPHRPRLFLLLLVLYAAAVSAASPADPPASWEPLFRAWLAMEDTDYGEETFTLLADLAETPLNLNTVTREDLEQLPFLSAQQIEDLQAYIDRYKPLRSLNELLMITSLDPDTRRLLSCFVRVGDIPDGQPLLPSLQSLLKEGRHTLQATVKIPTYQRKGDRTAYLGYPYRHDIRYQFNYRDRLKVGLTGAQDAGEPFFANKNRLGYDFYTYYLQLRHVGRLEELNLGMYRVQMGMGLLMNTGFHLGKLAVLQSLGRSSHALTAHSSRSAASYLRGAAATLRLADQWRLTALASYRPLDATLRDDGTVRTVINDGYHRTQTELSKKNNAHLTDLGLRLAWQSSRRGRPRLALNILYTHLDTAAFNASLDYGYTTHRLSFSGETALSRNGAIATIHSLSYRFSAQWSLMLLHRYYDKRYTAFHAHSFSEGSSVQNEHGVYLGTTWSPRRSLTLQAYLDYIRFPAPRYLASTSSQALDAMLLARTFIKSATLEARYRFHLRQRDNDTHQLLQNRYEHRARLRLNLPLISTSHPSPLTPHLSTSSQLDAALVDNRTNRSRGIMFSQQADFRHRWLRLNATVGWFHTDDYDSRLYQYEPSVRYDFSFPMYYGHGLHYALMAQADIRRLSLAAKLATTRYFDRSVIASGYQQIDHPYMTDILLQLRYQF